MKLTAESTVVNDTKLNTDIDNAQITAEASAKTATSYITYVNATDGIKVHNSDDASDYVQVNSSKIAMYRNNVEKMQLTDSALRLGDTSDYAKIDTDGMGVYKDGTSVAYFGTTARMGKSSGARVMISPDELLFLNENGVQAFHITQDKNNTVSNDIYVDVGSRLTSGNSVTVTFSGVSSGTSVAVRVDATNRVDSSGNSVWNYIVVTVGTSKSGTETSTDFARYSYSYNGTTLTITADQGDTLSIPYYYYSKLAPIPVVEINGKAYANSLYLNGHTSPVGDYWSVERTYRSSMTAGTVYNFGTALINTGIWLLRGQVSFGANSSSYRRVAFATSSTSCALTDISEYSGTQTAAAPSGPTVLEISYIVEVYNDNTEFYLNAISGAAISAESYGKIEQICLA